MKFSYYNFEELSNKQLYYILRIRSRVFVVEQNCIYQDIDNHDIKATHVLVEKNNKIIGYSRILKKGILYKNSCAIGRVLIDKNERRNKVGYLLMKFTIKTTKFLFKNDSIKISAQSHLKNFYNKQGFIYKGEDYLEDGIPHCAMYFD